jgi:kumamolisin
MRRRRSLDWVDANAARPAVEQRRCVRADWTAAHGADPADVHVVSLFATAHGLEVGEVSLARRAVPLTGALESFMGAFGVDELAMFAQLGGEPFRGRRGTLSTPQSLAGIVTGVFGIDDRPQARSYLSSTPVERSAHVLTPAQVAKAYDFPGGLDGTGESVGIIALGGGAPNGAALVELFSELGSPVPRVLEVQVDGETGRPSIDATNEVALDLAVIGTVAPGADLVVYAAPGTDDRSLIDTLSWAVHDGTHAPSVISITWGAPEGLWTAQARAEIERILLEAAALGVTVIVAAGDSGSTSGQRDGRQHVEFPASSPHALACGGTSLTLANGRVARETVWNDGPGGGATGGGVSVTFQAPAYQDGVSVLRNVDMGAPGRGVPDVSAHADPHTGYRVRINGQVRVLGGTSAAAPLWAGLTARVNQSLGQPVGFLNPQLYRLPPEVFGPVTDGDNGAYRASPGWDACTGLGTPKGAAILRALASAARPANHPPTQQGGSAMTANGPPTRGGSAMTANRPPTQEGGSAMTAMRQEFEVARPTAHLTIPVADVGALVAEQLCAIILEDNRACALLDQLAALVPATSAETGEPTPLCALIFSRAPIERRNGHLGDSTELTPFMDEVERADGGFPPSETNAGTTSSGSSDAGVADAGTMGSWWQINFSGGSFSWDHNADGSWDVSGASPHMTVKAGGGKKKP